jgi:hypothetical protein
MHLTQEYGLVIPVFEIATQGTFVSRSKDTLLPLWFFPCRNGCPFSKED